MHNSQAVDTASQYWISYHPAPALDELKAEQWQLFESKEMLARQQHNFWLRMDFELKEQPAEPQGLYVSLLGAYQLYWDGELIGENGVWGDSRASETPGLIDYLALLPQDSVQPGQHSLVLKVASYHKPADLQIFPLFTFLGDYRFLSTVGYQRGSLPMMMAATLLLMAVYCLALYLFTSREGSYLIFASLCGAIFGLIVVESWRGLWGYTYDWQLPRLQLVLALSCVISLLLTLFFAFSFRLSSRSRRLILVTVIGSQLLCLWLFDGYDERSLLVFIAGVIASAVICLYAFFDKQKDAWLMCLGLLLFVAPVSINSYSYMDQYFFLSFYALILLLLYRLIQSMRIKQQQLLQSKVNASRLELELVKRNIQPHFILNTLTAVEEWIEESPPTAVKFIQALADEFRSMAQVSAQSLISLQQEIQLCQAHMQVMGFRNNSQFVLQTQDCSLNLLLPPGVLLTLLENALSHNNYQQQQIVFTLEQKQAANGVSLIFRAPVSVAPAQKHINLGIGDKYIRARLTESFQQQWQMHSELNDVYWQVELNIPYREQEVTPQ